VPCGTSWGGFGLPKSEVAVAHRSWFPEVDGSVHCRNDRLANHGRNAQLRRQLGAWAKLAPFLDLPLTPSPSTALVPENPEREKSMVPPANASVPVSSILGAAQLATGLERMLLVQVVKSLYQGREIE